jgi:uncharacterized RDD family membrane protein YckC
LSHSRWSPDQGRPAPGPLDRVFEKREEFEAAVRAGVATPSDRRYEPPGRTTEAARLSYLSAHEANPVRGEQFAPFGWRVVGTVLDLIAVAVMWALGFAGTAGLAVPLYVALPEGSATYVAPALFTFIGAIPFLAVWTFNAQGWSPAGKVTHLRLVDEYGAPPGVRAGLVRTVALLPSILPLGLGFWAASWHPERQTWHDRIARTRVIQLLR